MSRRPVLDGLTCHTDTLRVAYRRGGKRAVKREIENHIEEINGWSEIPLRVGVIGRSGVGKSSFLNAIRQLDSYEGATADVGVTETTRRAKEFPHPRNRKLILCDLPGAGTSEFPLEKYVTDHRIKFYSFDMIIIMFCSRFTESEVHFLLSVASSGILCMFVRTKVAQDIDNERRTKKKHFAANPGAAEEIVDNIRRDCYENLKSLPEDISVYLIDNFDHDNEYLDYSALSHRLIDGFSELKKEAFVKMSHHDVMRQIKEAKFGRTRHGQARGDQTTGGAQEEACHIM